MNKNDIIMKRKIKLENFLWINCDLSTFVKNNFYKIFNIILDWFDKEIIIKKIHFDNDKFLVFLKSKNTKKDFEFYIKDNLGIKKCWWIYCTNNICFWNHNKIIDKEFLRFLLYFSKKWINLKFNSFFDIVSKDINIKKDYYKFFYKPQRPLFSIIQDWWEKTHKIRFISHEWLMRDFSKNLKFNFSEAYIHHSERECLWVWANVEINKEYHFFSYPKEYFDHSFDKYFYIQNDKEKNILKSKVDLSISFFTDLDENDIVMWKWNEKLENTLCKVVSNIKKNQIKALNFNCCCVPRVIWDDVKSILERTKSKIDIPFLFSWQLEKTVFEQKIYLIETYLSKIKNELKKIEKNTIILFWYHENIYLKYLNDILLINWVKLIAIFIPTIDVLLLEKLFQAELFVFSQNKFQEEIFEYPFKNMWVKYITPKYPYWVNNTIEWFVNIFDNLWKKYLIGDTEKQYINEYNTLVNYVKDKKYRIWIVFLWKQQLDIFFDTSYTNNIDIIEFLEEMWFWINFYIFNDISQNSINNFEKKINLYDFNDIITTTINNKVKFINNHNIIFFNNESQLYNSIKNDNVNLIYSDIYFDDRIYKLWLNLINLKFFDIWYLWAIHTIKQIIKAIEMNFFKNFWKYFN